MIGCATRTLTFGICVDVGIRLYGLFELYLHTYPAKLSLSCHNPRIAGLLSAAPPIANAQVNALRFASVRFPIRLVSERSSVQSRQEAPKEEALTNVVGASVFAEVPIGARFSWSRACS